MKEYMQEHGINTIYGMILAWIITWLQKLHKKNKANEEGTLALLHNNIVTIHERWTERGYMPVYQKEALERTYNAYKGLGGNGTITDLYNECRNLPVKPKKKKEGK